MRTSAIVIQDIASRASAQIRPDLGFNCFSFKARVHDRPVEAFWSEPSFADGEGKPSRSGNPILFPFGGRIGGAKYTFGGREYTVNHAGENGPNAIHGFVFNRRWRVTDLSSDRVVGEFQGSVDAPETLADWPSDYRIQLAYSIAGNTLTADVTISNPGKSTLPFTFALHPYFRVPLGNGDAEQTRITIPASEYWVLRDLLPTGEQIPVDAMRDFRAGKPYPEIQVDDVLTGLTATNGEIATLVEDHASGVRLAQRFSDEYRFCIAYTPVNREAIAIEPYTGAPDPFRTPELGLDPNLSLLEPGKQWHSSVSYTLEAID
jgi:aldose 1-epimerase